MVCPVKLLMETAEDTNLNEQSIYSLNASTIINENVIYND